MHTTLLLPVTATDQSLAQICYVVIPCQCVEDAWKGRLCCGSTASIHDSTHGLSNDSAPSLCLPVLLLADFGCIGHGHHLLILRISVTAASTITHWRALRTQVNRRSGAVNAGFGWCVGIRESQPGCWDEAISHASKAASGGLGVAACGYDTLRRRFAKWRVRGTPALLDTSTCLSQPVVCNNHRQLVVCQGHQQQPAANTGYVFPGGCGAQTARTTCTADSSSSNT